MYRAYSGLSANENRIKFALTQRWRVEVAKLARLLARSKKVLYFCWLFFIILLNRERPSHTSLYLLQTGSNSSNVPEWREASSSLTVGWALITPMTSSSSSSSSSRRSSSPAVLQLDRLALWTCCCTVWVKKNPPWGFLTFFPKRLGIFSPNFTHLGLYTFLSGVQIFIQLSFSSP